MRLNKRNLNADNDSANMEKQKKAVNVHRAPLENTRFCLHSNGLKISRGGTSVRLPIREWTSQSLKAVWPQWKKQRYKLQMYTC